MKTKRPVGPPGGEDFSLMFKESIRSVQPGDVRAGRFVNVGPEFVAVGIGYKSEGHIPLAEFRQRDGQATVSKGDAVDVCFDSANSDQESIVLSPCQGRAVRHLARHPDCVQHRSADQGEIVGKVKGGLRVNVSVPALLPGAHVDIRPACDLDHSIGQTGKFVVLKFDVEEEHISLGLKQLVDDPREPYRSPSGVLPHKAIENREIPAESQENISEWSGITDTSNETLEYAAQMGFRSEEKPRDHQSRL